MDLHPQNRQIAGPTLQTARLTLRGLHKDDLDDVVRHAGDYEVSKWLVAVPHPYTYGHAEEFFALDREGGLGTLWVITRDKAFFGIVSVGNSLGYWLARDAWGQGYMSEAAQAAVDHHFEGTADEVIRSSHFEGNHGSQRILQKLGFVEVGAHVHFSKAQQANVPGREMTLSRAHWRALRNG